MGTATNSGGVGLDNGERIDWLRTRIRAGVGARPAFTEQMLGVNALQETPGPP